MVKFQIHIPEPCSEKWERMQPTARGSFCSSCQQEVVDFTAMTDQQLAAYFSKNAAGCGRFKANQLNSAYSNSEDKPLLWRSWLLAIVVSLGLPAVANAHNKPLINPGTTQSVLRFKTSPVDEVPVSTLKKPFKLEPLTGVVRDSISKEPLPGVAIRINGSGEAVITDVDGAFVLKTEMLQEQDIIYFNYIGYKDRFISLSELRKNPEVLLAEDLETLSEVIMVGGYHAVRWYTPRGMWWRIKGIFQRH